MSNPSTPQDKPPKAMSSRLLTMKFMQRAAASPTTPPSESSSSAKRQRTDSNASFDVNALADQRAVETALATEETKRQMALDKQARDAGDTRWVLNFQPGGRAGAKSGLRVQPASFAAIDRGSVAVPRSEEGLDEPTAVGRKSFGRFNRKLEKAQGSDAEDESSSDSSDDEDEAEESGDDDDDDDPTSQLMKDARNDAARKLKAERKTKRKSEKAELQRMADKRKRKQVKLNTLTSISGTGGSGSSKGPCHKCGMMGHYVSECTGSKKRDRGDEEGDRKGSAKKQRMSG